MTSVCASAGSTVRKHRVICEYALRRSIIGVHILQDGKIETMLELVQRLQCAADGTKQKKREMAE